MTILNQLIIDKTLKVMTTWFSWHILEWFLPSLDRLPVKVLAEYKHVPSSHSFYYLPTIAVNRQISIVFAISICICARLRRLRNSARSLTSLLYSALFVSKESSAMCKSDGHSALCHVMIRHDSFFKVSSQSHISLTLLGFQRYLNVNEKS